MKSIFPTLIIGSVFIYFFWENIREIKNKQIEFGVNTVLAEKSNEAGSKAVTPTQVKKKEDEVRKQMLQISKDLGVTCTYCHNVKNWKEDSKPEWKIASEHIKLMDSIRTFSMNGKDKPTETGCFMCHRGEAKYKWR